MKKEEKREIKTAWFCGLYCEDAGEEERNCKEQKGGGSVLFIEQMILVQRVCCLGGFILAEDLKQKEQSGNSEALRNLNYQMKRACVVFLLIVR
ncbi:hypothetical protein CDAR_610501 [Caerostris darwini]|uniref:Uncharacterized protein n=1 Tax=Caerostris darwini TaxID=1538125 RepID=A0AAV4PYL8_9ARAC|nr:hypothetical protein CDAR_610501 [Caerostris darwini]